jgi:hypothetical protein
MHFGNPPAENPKAADGDAMLHNSPTAELEMKSPTATAVPLTLAHYSSTVVAGLVFDALPNFVPLAGCCISSCTVFIVSRGKARRTKQGARIAMADRLVFVRCQAYKGIQFGGERHGDVGWGEGEVGPELDVVGFGESLQTWQRRRT